MDKVADTDVYGLGYRFDHFHLLVRVLLHSVKPPLSVEFAVAMMELLTSARYVS
jgi:hypothetical protein